MIQITLIQIDNYGPWTVTPRPRAESDLQTLQSELFADVERMFASNKGLVFFNRFDNMLAISNGVDKEAHIQIQRSVRNRYPFTISMGVGSGENAYIAQEKASKALQKAGGAQCEDRKEILAIDSLVEKEDSFVQIAHIDINGVTKNLTDIVPEYDTSIAVICTQYHLMMKLKEYGALLFFIGGDNYMSPCNNVSEDDIKKIIDDIYKEVGISLKAGIGRATNANRCANLADVALERIRSGEIEEPILILDKE